MPKNGVNTCKPESQEPINVVDGGRVTCSALEAGSSATASAHLRRSGVTERASTYSLGPGWRSMSSPLWSDRARCEHLERGPGGVVCAVGLLEDRWGECGARRDRTREVGVGTMG